MSLDQFLLWANLAATGTMCGVILFVQVVHYPMIDDWDRATFRAVARRHQRLTAFVVGPPMLVELVATVALLFVRPTGLAWAGLALVGVWAGVTAFVSIPLHEKLAADGYDAAAHRRLVRTNWVRVAAWWLHGGVCVAMLATAR
jgi:ABC-type molybdate transport system permease subunit